MLVLKDFWPITVRRVWRYQRDNQNPYIEEDQTTQCPKEKVQKNKQRSTKHTHKTKDRVTRPPIKTGGELRCSGRVGSSCSTSDTRRVTLVTNPVHCEGKLKWMSHNTRYFVIEVVTKRCLTVVRVFTTKQQSLTTNRSHSEIARLVCTR
jgi:hypothetical protein